MNKLSGLKFLGFCLLVSLRAGALQCDGISSGEIENLMNNRGVIHVNGVLAWGVYTGSRPHPCSGNPDGAAFKFDRRSKSARVYECRDGEPLIPASGEGSISCR